MTHREYYYRRLYTDAVMAIDTVRAHELVDPARVIVARGSQGGGLATAAAALEPSVWAALVDIPFLRHFRRAVEVAPPAPT